MYDDLTPRERLARIVAEETGDGRRIVKFLVQVAEGDLDSEGFQPCHRMDSAKELIKRGFDETYTCAASDNTVMPVSEAGPETDSAQLKIDNSELTTDEEPTDYLAIVKRVVESLGPYEEEEKDPNGHKPDLSMWDAIEYPPLSEITDEHAQIGAALFHEAVERSKA
jgi:hypothetical protein